MYVIRSTSKLTYHITCIPFLHEDSTSKRNCSELLTKTKTCTWQRQRRMTQRTHINRKKHSEV